MCTILRTGVLEPLHFHLMVSPSCALRHAPITNSLNSFRQRIILTSLGTDHGSEVVIMTNDHG